MGGKRFFLWNLNDSNYDFIKPWVRNCHLPFNLMEKKKSSLASDVLWTHVISNKLKYQNILLLIWIPI